MASASWKSLGARGRWVEADVAEAVQGFWNSLAGNAKSVLLNESRGHHFVHLPNNHISEQDLLFNNQVLAALLAQLNPTF
eukprot:8822370-Alexandrium_andersonii.AAC.1